MSGSRQRTHSPSAVVLTVPVTSTPSITASNRRSSAIWAPARTAITSLPIGSVAVTSSSSVRIDPGRRPRSWVEIWY